MSYFHQVFYMDCIGLPMHCISPSIVGINKLMHSIKRTRLDHIKYFHFFFIIK